MPSEDFSKYQVGFLLCRNARRCKEPQHTAWWFMCCSLHLANMATCINWLFTVHPLVHLFYDKKTEIIISQCTATLFILSTCVFSIKCGKGANPQTRALGRHPTAQPLYRIQTSNNHEEMIPRTYLVFTSFKNSTWLQKCTLQGLSWGQKAKNRHMWSSQISRLLRDSLFLINSCNKTNENISYFLQGLSVPRAVIVSSAAIMKLRSHQDSVTHTYDTTIYRLIVLSISLTPMSHWSATFLVVTDLQGH